MLPTGWQCVVVSQRRGTSHGKKGASAWSFCLSPLYNQPSTADLIGRGTNLWLGAENQREEFLHSLTRGRITRGGTRAEKRAPPRAKPPLGAPRADRFPSLLRPGGRGTEGRRENKVRGEERADGMRGPLSPSLSLRRPSATSTSRNFPAGGDGGEGQQSIQQTVPDDRRPSTSSSTLPMSPVSSRRGPL